MKSMGTPGERAARPGRPLAAGSAGAPSGRRDEKSETLLPWDYENHSTIELGTGRWRLPASPRHWPAVPTSLVRRGNRPMTCQLICALARDSSRWMRISRLSQPLTFDLNPDAQSVPSMYCVMKSCNVAQRLDVTARTAWHVSNIPRQAICLLRLRSQPKLDDERVNSGFC